MTRHCGLVEPGNVCRCSKKVGHAVAAGRVDPERPLFAASIEKARSFQVVRSEIRRLEHTQRAAALYRSHAHGEEPKDFVLWLREMLLPHAAR